MPSQFDRVWTLAPEPASVRLTPVAAAPTVLTPTPTARAVTMPAATNKAGLGDASQCGRFFTGDIFITYEFNHEAAAVANRRQTVGAGQRLCETARTLGNTVVGDKE